MGGGGGETVEAPGGVKKRKRKRRGHWWETSELKEEGGAKQVKVSIKEGEGRMDRKRRTSGKCWHRTEGYRREEEGERRVHKGQRLSIQQSGRHQTVY